MRLELGTWNLELGTWWWCFALGERSKLWGWGSVEGGYEGGFEEALSGNWLADGFLALCAWSRCDGDVMMGLSLVVLLYADRTW